MQGQINSSLRYLSVDDCGGVLPLTDDVMRQLRDKHTEAQDAKLGSILFGPVEDVHDSLYQQIDGEMIRGAALRTKGSGVDANGFKRILTSKSFKKSSANLCDALAIMTRTLCKYLLIHGLLNQYKPIGWYPWTRAKAQCAQLCGWSY